MSKTSIKEERRKKEKRQQIFAKMRQIFAKIQRKFRRDSVNINCLHFKKSMKNVVMVKMRRGWLRDGKTFNKDFIFDSTKCVTEASQARRSVEAGNVRMEMRE